MRFSSLRVTTTSPITLASCIASRPRRHVDGIDDSDDSCVDGTIFQAGSHTRGAATDDQHRFADTGVDGVDATR